MEFTNRFVVERPAAKVFAYLAAFDRMPEWNTEVLSSEIVTPGLPRAGTRFVQRRRLLGRQFDETFSVVDIVPDRTIAASSTGGLGLGFSFELEDLGGRTRVASRVTTRLPGLLRILEPLTAPIAGRRIAAHMRDLKAGLEAGH